MLEVIRTPSMAEEEQTEASNNLSILLDFLDRGLFGQGKFFSYLGNIPKLVLQRLAIAKAYENQR